MGAYEFEEYGAGKDAATVFAALREDAAWEYGHGGYTGTIAEKGDFIEVEAEPITWTQAQKKLLEWNQSDDFVYHPVKMPQPRRSSIHDFPRGYGYGGAAMATRDGIDLNDKWGPAGCIEIKRSSIPKEMLLREFGVWESVTRTETRRDIYGRMKPVTVHGSERRPPKRGTRFFIFFGFASS